MPYMHKASILYLNRSLASDCINDILMIKLTKHKCTGNWFSKRSAMASDPRGIISKGSTQVEHAISTGSKNSNQEHLGEFSLVILIRKRTFKAKEKSSECWCPCARIKQPERKRKHRDRTNIGQVAGSLSKTANGRPLLTGQERTSHAFRGAFYSCLEQA